MNLRNKYFAQQKRLAIIDADSIIYIIAWRNRDHDIVSRVQKELNQFMIDLATITRATHYLGTFSDSRTFRHDVAVTKPYKGNRGPAPEWIVKWKKVIKDYCINEYGFMQPSNVEADDVLSVMRGDNIVYCSPDKDLRQIPGLHYDYTKDEWDESTINEAAYIYWKQVLTGDSTDHIPGLRKMGPKTAEKLLKNAEPHEWESIVENTYKTKLLGNETWYDYYLEQLSLVTLLRPCEALIENYSKFIQAIEFSGEESLDTVGLNNEIDELLQSDQRTQLGDILPVATDLS